MKQAQFEQLYAQQWQRFGDYLQRLEDGGGGNWKTRKQARLSSAEYDEFAQLYRKLCHYHALARDRQYSSYRVDTLADLVVRGHQQFYRRKYQLWRNVVHFLVAEFPLLVRRERNYIWAAMGLFYLPALCLFLAVLWQPQLVFSVVSPSQVNELEAMYNPANQILGSARDAGSNWHMFGFYINNNIGVAFRTFASGLLWGIGSVFFLFYNGLLLGAVAGHLTEIGYSQTFFSFVIGHGSFELTAITVAGAAGLKLGYSLLVPGNRSRLASLRAAARIAIKLVFGVIAMLLVAAFIEAFWSASGWITHTQKYWMGVALWLLVFAYLVFGGRRGSE